ncbi:signal peptide protein [Methylobacterium sp. AMS5]|nr:signal peptide protein [Methylobacterium sp. AMS5]
MVSPLSAKPEQPASSPEAALEPSSPLAQTLCRALSGAIDATGPGPAFVASYRPGPSESELPAPLRSSAFTYDNALAAIALVACGEISRARRIGDALLRALARDRTFSDGRVRNAYRAGPIGAGPLDLPGWWDAKQNLWAEDPYQDGTATGNVAWAALALLTVDAVAPEGGYRAGARRMLAWISDQTTDRRDPEGYSGGVDGFDPSQARLTWKSTEHNLDVHAVAAWLHRLDGRPEEARIAGIARGFLGAAFARAPGVFRLGTTPEGQLQPTTHIALDTQLWPLIGVTAAPEDWRRALGFAETHLATREGFDFNEDRDGLWVEGTAQAALTFRALGRRSEAERLLSTIGRHVSPSGFLFATDVDRLTTGIAIGPASTGADFYYFRRPHLGATAWGVLAATGWNPFTGRRVE